MRRIRRGDVVYDIADQRHHGIVESVHLRLGQLFANVRWLETRFRSCRIPLEDLRIVPPETPDRTECSIMSAALQTSDRENTDLHSDEMASFDADMEADEAAD